MRLAVSNIAWMAEEDEDLERALVSEGVDAIELAPTRVWPDTASVGAVSARTERARLEDRGLEVVAFQSLLFARPDLALFADSNSRAGLAAHLSRIARLAGWMGAGRLVFGSPAARAVPSGMHEHEAFDLAVQFFREAGEVAAGEGTVLCIEPNPPEYGCNFVTTAAEGIALVSAVDSSGFGLHLDSAGLVLAGDDPADAARRAGPLISHVHASAPQLAELEQGVVDHPGFGVALRDVGYRGTVSIEMRSGPIGTNRQRVVEALRIAVPAYGR